MTPSRILACDEDKTAITIPFKLVREVIFDHEALKKEHEREKKNKNKSAGGQVDYERLVTRKRVKKWMHWAAGPGSSWSGPPGRASESK